MRTLHATAEKREFNEKTRYVDTVVYNILVCVRYVRSKQFITRSGTTATITEKPGTIFERVTRRRTIESIILVWFGTI